MLTLDLLQAAADVLERERQETDWTRRARLLARTRATLDRWRAGRLTAEQATLALRQLQWEPSCSSFRVNSSKPSTNCSSSEDASLPAPLTPCA